MKCSESLSSQCGKDMFHIGAGLLQPRRLRPLNGPIRHPQGYSQLRLGTKIYRNVRDFLMKLTRSPTVKCWKLSGCKYGFPHISSLRDAYRSHTSTQWAAISYAPWPWLQYGWSATRGKDIVWTYLLGIFFSVPYIYK